MNQITQVFTQSKVTDVPGSHVAKLLIDKANDYAVKHNLEIVTISHHVRSQHGYGHDGHIIVVFKKLENNINSVKLLEFE